MAVNIGPKIGIDGEAEYRKELKGIIQETKTLTAESDAAAAAFKNESDNEEKATDAAEKHKKAIEAQKKLIAKLEEAVQKSAEATGESSQETLKWKEQLAKARMGLETLEGQTKDTTEEVKDLGEEEKTTGDKTSVFGDVLKGSLASAAIQKGLELTKKIVKELADFFVDAVKDAEEYADEINTLNKTTGLGTDTLQEYRYMADLVDVELGTITGSLTKLKKNMDSARDGNAAAAEAFENLGIKITDTNGELRSAEDVFNDALDALRRIKNPTERDAAAMELFGKSATELNPLIETSAEDLEALRKEAHKTGAVLDKDALDSLNELKDGMSRMGLSWDALKRTLGTKIGIKALPEIEKLIKAFQKLVETGNVGQFIDNITRELTKERNWDKIGKKIGDILGRILGSAPKIIAAGTKMAVGLIKGLISGIPDMVNAIGDELRKSNLSDATRDIIYDLENVRKALDEIPDATERMASSLGDINGNQKQAERWIEIFDSLYEKTNPTAQETERLNTAVAKLKDLYPDLNLKIDESTGKWSLNTEEIRQNIEALSDKYRSEAYYAAASETLTDIAKLEAESETYREQKRTLDGQVEALEELLSVKGKIMLKAGDLRAQWIQGKISLEEYTQAISTMSGEQIDSWQKADKYLDDTIKTYYRVKDQLAEYKLLQEEVGITVDEYDNKINNLNKDVEYLWSKADEYSARAYKTLDKVESELDKREEEILKRSKKIGQAIDDGVTEGIRANAGKIGAAAKNAVSGAISAMKRIAQINSPSKVTEDVIGKNLALGVVEGWDDVMNPAKLSTAFSLTPAFDAMTQNMTTNTTNTTNLGGVSVNVYAAEGMDVNALTDAIMIKMQKAVNNKKAVFSNEFHIQ